MVETTQVGRVGRRRFLVGSAVALGGLGAAGLLLRSPAMAQASGRRRASRDRAGKRPGRDNFIITGAYIMTMDRALGDIERGDIHVDNGAIVAVGRDLKAAGATRIDGRSMIVLPGFVETHWHMWNSLLRSMAGDAPEKGYFRTTATLGKVYLPEDMYQGTRLAAAEAISSGITFVHDWCHNIRSPEHARADLRALRDTGIRARFSYGTAQGIPINQLADLGDIEKLRAEWAQQSNGGLISLGFAWRGQGGNSARIPAEVWQREFETGRRLGLPISVHASGSRPTIGQIADLATANVLSKDVQVVHANFATQEEIQSLASAGASVSSSPYSELRIGFGLQQTGKFLAAGVPVGLSVDTTELGGDVDMFAIMKAIQNVENGETENEFKLTARRALELATIEGARSMNIDSSVGSLVPGKRADLIMVSTRGLNMGVFTDPAHMIVECGQPANVDTVVIDGRILKQHGKLTAIAADQVIDGAAAALVGIRKRANWS
jgi:5-methylthioadenosine/S-adenosylhomocysteine deaminase